MTALIVDLWPPGRGIGHVDGVRTILQRDLGRRVHVLSRSRTPQLAESAGARMLVAGLRAHDPRDVFVLGSPVSMVADDLAAAALGNDLADRTVVYWDSDAWGRGKPISDSIRFWTMRADHLFHVGGFPDAGRLASTRTRIHLTPQTYCHLRFAAAEDTPPQVDHEWAIAMIGRNATRSGIPIPGLTGLPGGLPRWLLARGAVRRVGPGRFHLRGDDWPRSWSVGPVAYGSQIDVLRRAGVSIIWNHFSDHARYASDRLAISLLAGRPHVTNGDHSLTCGLGREIGLHEESTVSGILDRAISLLDQPQHVRHEHGLAGWEWARHRLSTRELAQFMLARVGADVPAPEMDPWRSLPPASLGTAERTT